MTHEELLTLLRDPSLKPESICEEMECAGSPGCGSEAVSEARALLLAATGGDPPTAAEAQVQGERLGRLPEALQPALLRAAAEAGRQELLQAVATKGAKGLAKEAKRELQRLKQRGVKVAELQPQGESVLKALADTAAPDCYASSIDAFGERAIWFARANRSGIEVAQVVLSDVKGILAADALSFSRRNHREFLKRLPRSPTITVAEVPAEHARWVVAQAEEEGVRNGFSPPASYPEALRILGASPSAPPSHPADSIDLGPEGELPHQLAGAALFDDPLFFAWIPDEAPLKAFAGRIDAIDASALYADEGQKHRAREEAAEAAAADYFTATLRLRYSHRLLEMAHVLRVVGRIDAARTALATARALGGQGGAAQAFCTGLFRHATELSERDAGAR
jgi:hypothetical protein